MQGTPDQMKDYFKNIVSVRLIYVENVTYTFNLGHFREKQ